MFELLLNRDDKIKVRSIPAFLTEPFSRVRFLEVLLRNNNYDDDYNYYNNECTNYCI